MGALDCGLSLSLFFPAAEEDAPLALCMGCLSVWGDSIMIEYLRVVRILRSLYFEIFL